MKYNKDSLKSEQNPQEDEKYDGTLSLYVSIQKCNCNK